MMMVAPRVIITLIRIYKKDYHDVGDTILGRMIVTIMATMDGL